ELAKLDIVYKEAGIQIGLDEGTTWGLASTISAASKGNTQILTLSVRSAEPGLAQQYVEALAKALKSVGAEKLGQDNIQLLDAPALPGSPISPNIQKNTVTAFGAGLVIALFIAFLLEYLDTRIKRPEETERLTGLPIVGMIPLLDEKAEKNEVITNTKSIPSEAYRVLRTNIRLSKLDKDIQVISVTSATPTEGKSTTVANLAATFAQTGKRTLIIDADLRKPTMHKQFDLAKMRGLSSVLVEMETFEACVQKCKNQENLDILVSGPLPPNPSEMLESHKFAAFIDTVRNEYDVIIIDAPPILAVADAQIISEMTDRTLLVAAYNQVHKDQLLESTKRLKKVDANVMGVVMTKVDMRNQNGDYYYYYYQNN
ncbi:MAG: polysaccharide biosynthesis tyrosine autokinase, partial [Culicoidibacterales bacterium]